MLVRTPDGRAAHLTYCTNVHPGETAADATKIVRGPVRAVREALRDRIGDVVTKQPFAVGLRWSAAAARTLRHDDHARRAFERALTEIDGDALTVNAFPASGFHRPGLGSQVYEPDWHAPARVAYTLDVAKVLATLPTTAAFQSISTVPGSFKAFGGNDLDAIAKHFVDVARAFAELEERTGRQVALAVEPEPGCSFERTDEWIRFYDEHLRLAARHDGVTDETLHRHVGTCLDTCHQAVWYEDLVDVVRRLADAEIPVFKVQLSSALRLEAADDAVLTSTDDAVRELASFDEPVYLHQTVARTRGGELRYFEDIPEFVRAVEMTTATPQDEDEAFIAARSHFHVPIYRDDLGTLATTRADLERTLTALPRLDPMPHLEIETYSWGVMPERRHVAADTERLTDDIVREYDWVIGRLPVIPTATTTRPSDEETHA